MKRITLVRPPFYSLSGVSSASHPLSIGYLSSSLNGNGYEVSIVDGERISSNNLSKLSVAYANLKQLLFPYLNANKNIPFLDEVMNDYYSDIWNVIVNNIINTRPDIVGITCFTVSMTAVKIIVKRLLESIPDVKIILGGIHISSMSEQTLRSIPGLSCLVVGEGEQTIVELCDEFNKKSPSLENVKGIAYLSSTGKFIRTQPRELIPNLDDLALPTREWPEYNYSSHLGITSRGCPFTCNFCDSKSIWTRKVRYVSMDRVMAELDQIRNMGINLFRYSDDTFTLKRSRIAEWCKLVRENGYNKEMKFGFGTRVELINREVVEDYTSAGVVDISFGIETGSQRIRKIISKVFLDVDPYEKVKIVNDAGIGTRTYFIIGHPTERPEDIEDSISLIKRMCSLPRNYVEINICCPYPGTELWRLAMEKTNGNPFLDIDTFYKMSHQASPIVNLTDMNDAELRKYIKVLYRISTLSVLKSRFTVWGKQLLNNPSSTIKFIKRRIIS